MNSRASGASRVGLVGCVKGHEGLAIFHIEGLTFGVEISLGLPVVMPVLHDDGRFSQIAPMPATVGEGLPNYTGRTLVFSGATAEG